MTTIHLYEVVKIREDGTRGRTDTIRSGSPIRAAAGFSGMPRHNWERDGDGLVVTARRGDGTEAGKYHVRHSCFDDLPPTYPLA